MASGIPALLPAASVLYAFRQSDGVARFIVFLLVLLSIYAWTIMVEKGLVMRRARRGSVRFLRQFARAVSPLELALQMNELDGPLAELYEAGVTEVMDVLDVEPDLLETYFRRRALPRPLSAHELAKVRSTLEHGVATQIALLEARLGLLGTVVTVSPFLGLLGTVWGVMMAFCGMAQQGRPEMSAIAPGVSGALLTTVVGLVVAIPAVVGYNLLANAIRRTTVEMDNFVEEFLALLKLETPGTAGPD